MLLTMEAAYEDAVELMPNPERLDKVRRVGPGAFSTERISTDPAGRENN